VTRLRACRDSFMGVPQFRARSDVCCDCSTCMPSLQHAATHCNTLQHTAKYCNILAHCNALQWIDVCAVTCLCACHDSFTCVPQFRAHSSVCCNHFMCMLCLQHTATHCNTLQHTATHCNTLQHTAAHYNTLHHTAAHSFMCMPSLVRECAP